MPMAETDSCHRFIRHKRLLEGGVIPEEYALSMLGGEPSDLGTAFLGLTFEMCPM